MALLVNKQERFVRPIDCWEDTYEGYMLHMLDSDNGARKVLTELYNNVDEQDVDATIRDYTKLQRTRYVCYGQSWSYEHDSDAMWRIYAYENKGIQLISDRSRILRMIKASGRQGISVRCEQVHYVPVGKDDLKTLLKKGAKVENAYFRKRKAFAHEREQRVIINDTDQWLNYTAFSSQAIKLNYKRTDTELPEVERIFEASKHVSDPQNNLYSRSCPATILINVNNVQDYISGIRVHPQSKQWFVDLIEKICSQYGIVFKGQSPLYQSVKIV